MIVFNNWQIAHTGDLLARQYDNLSRTLLVKGVPEGYDWTMMVQVEDKFDILPLTPMEDGVGIVLTKDQLSISGYYTMQLVGTLQADGVTVRHTNVLRTFIPPSLSGDANWPTVPSEFSQVEANIKELNGHPSIPGENGFWLVWDLDSHSYVESEFQLPEVSAGGTGTGGGTTDHNKLTNRSAADQHPMSSITGLVNALDGKQPTGAYLTQETDPTVPAWAKAAAKPSYTASEVGADPSGTADAKVAAHNTGTDAHSDIRLLISGLTDRINALADSDDTTLDQLSEVVAYIKSNRTLIEAITTSKVSVADIVDNLTTNVSNKPLSAAQGVALKALIDAITVPDKLPNPNALTFTGAVNGSYDGSAPLIVEIPSGGGDENGSDAGYKDSVQLLDITLDDETAGLKNYEYDVSGIEKTDVIIINLLFPESYGSQITIKNQSDVTLTTEFASNAKGMTIGLKIMNGRYMHSCVQSLNTSARVDMPLSLFYGQINGGSGFERPKAPNYIAKIKFSLTSAFVSGTRIRIFRW